MTNETTENVVGTGLQITRLLQHMRDNNIAYMVGIYVAYSIGLMAEAQTYAAGICS